MIDFPSDPVHGTSYTYLGVIYNYKKLTGEPGFWQVSTVGTYGPALASEINTGTDPVKYVTPLELENSHYINNNDVATHVDINSGIDFYKYVTGGALALSQYAKQAAIDIKMHYVPLYPPVRLLDYNGSAGGQDSDFFFQASTGTYPGLRFCNLVLNKDDGQGADSFYMFSSDNIYTDVRGIHALDYVDTPPMMVEANPSGVMQVRWGQFDTTGFNIWMLGYWVQER